MKLSPVSSGNFPPHSMFSLILSWKPLPGGIWVQKVPWMSPHWQEGLWSVSENHKDCTLVPPDVRGLDLGFCPGVVGLVLLLCVCGSQCCCLWFPTCPYTMSSCTVYLLSASFHPPGLLAFVQNNMVFEGMIVLSGYFFKR